MTPTARSYRYRIMLDGHLENRWLHWFEEVVIDQYPDGTTCIQGLMDQSTLHGILNVIRDLGLELISVKRMEGADTL